jgi:hypothetical protein
MYDSETGLDEPGGIMGNIKLMEILPCVVLMSWGAPVYIPDPPAPYMYQAQLSNNYIVHGGLPGDVFTVIT